MSEAYYRFEVLALSPVQMGEIFTMIAELYSLDIGLVVSVPFDPNAWTVSLIFKQDLLSYSKKIGPYPVKTRDPVSSQLSLLCSYLSIKDNSYEIAPQFLYECLLASYPNVPTSANGYFDYCAMIKESLSSNNSLYHKNVVGVMEFKNSNVLSPSVEAHGLEQVYARLDCRGVDANYFVPKPPGIGRDVFCCLNEIVQFNNKLRMCFTEYTPKNDSPHYGHGFGCHLRLTVEGKFGWCSPNFDGTGTTKKAARSVACQYAFDHYLKNLSVYGIMK